MPRTISTCLSETLILLSIDCKKPFNSRQSTASNAGRFEPRGFNRSLVNRHRLDARVQQDWANVRLQLNQLASVYNVTWRRRDAYINGLSVDQQ